MCLYSWSSICVSVLEGCFIFKKCSPVDINWTLGVDLEILWTILLSVSSVLSGWGYNVTNHLLLLPAWFPFPGILYPSLYETKWICLPLGFIMSWIWLLQRVKYLQLQVFLSTNVMRHVYLSPSTKLMCFPQYSRDIVHAVQRQLTGL